MLVKDLVTLWFNASPTTLETQWQKTLNLSLDARESQFNADGSNYWLINPNGGTFAGPPTIYGTQG